MKLILEGEKNTEVEGDIIIIQYKGKCMKLHPGYPLCFVHKNKAGEIIEDVPLSEDEAKKIKKFFEKIKFKEVKMSKKEKGKKENGLLKPIGGPQTCPQCGLSNPSGRKLPEQCRWCDKSIEKKTKKTALK